ncbi:MAG: bifunctional folylpolyglutamate synthase/dihydrofolate synthase [Ruminococcaceae bacterium]|nr:bifunctional folylpolyglutamate synthase/dihydrofolate synthase [Oscillospiraceae bacterium]
MNYQDTIQYLHVCSRLGSRPGLDSIREILFRLDNPEKSLRFIHIAGTNGKGSIGCYITEMLGAAGYCVGFYTSPAVYSPCEIMRINSREISKADFAKTITTVRQVAESMVEEGLYPPTEFEILTATAYLYFAQRKCDLVVVECGMGGRLDATNVMENVEVSVLTRIDYDHMAFLGSTLSAITKEKCGILHQACPVVVYPCQEEEVYLTIVEEANKRGCRIYIPDLHALTEEGNDAEGLVFSYGPYSNLTLPMRGRHQIYNAITAVEVMHVLQKSAFSISAQAIREGLHQSRWLGRFEVLSQNPPVILDGAHNSNGVSAFIATIKQCFPGTSFIGVLGMLRDKDYGTCIQMLSEICDTLIITEVYNSRTANITELRQAAGHLPISLLTVPNPEQAVYEAFICRNSSQGIVCVGSLYNLPIYKAKCQQLLENM